VAFARVRELIGASSQTFEIDAGSTVRDLWRRLAKVYPDLEALAESTRVARNGRLVSLDAPLAQGAEVALLPPVGGG
jgi:MoaD family protein